MDTASEYISRLQLCLKGGIFLYLFTVRFIYFFQYQYGMSPSAVACVLVGFQLITTSTTLGFTSGRSWLRPIAFALLMLCTRYQLSTIEEIQHPIGRAFAGAASVFLVILYIDVALLSRWTFDARGPTASWGGLDPIVSGQPKKPSATQSSWSTLKGALDRLQFGLGVSLQSRFPGTKWPVKNIPPFSKNDPCYVPSRLEFILRNTLKCVIFILVLRLSTSLGNPAQNPVFFSSARIPFLRRLGSVSASEMSTRLFGVLGYWTVQYIVIQLLYSTIAIVAVSLHMSDVRVWPPVFGPIDEAWSLRQFWG